MHAQFYNDCCHKLTKIRVLLFPFSRLLRKIRVILHFVQQRPNDICYCQYQSVNQSKCQFLFELDPERMIELSRLPSIGYVRWTHRESYRFYRVRFVNHIVVRANYIHAKAHVKDWKQTHHNVEQHLQFYQYYVLSDWVYEDQNPDVL